MCMLGVRVVSVGLGTCIIESLVGGRKGWRLHAEVKDTKWQEERQ